MNNKESVPDPQQGIDRLRTILFPERERTILGTWMTDLDDTVKESQEHEWTDGQIRRVLPETVAAFRTLHQIGIPIGIATEQSFSEIEPFLDDVVYLALGENFTARDLFNGPMIGEGGSVVQFSNGNRVIRAKNKFLEERRRLLEWISDNLTLSEQKKIAEDGWHVLAGVDPHTEGTWVQLPSEEDQGDVTISVWEKGSHISECPEDAQKYKVVEDRIKTAMNDLDITRLATYEAGNGTLRIVPQKFGKSVNKAYTAQVLHRANKSFRLGFDMGTMVYSCDGHNDIELAQQLQAHDGGVIAVGNAVQKLRDIADYSATGHAGLGFAETVEEMFSEQYKEALKNLVERNLGLQE